MKRSSPVAVWMDGDLKQRLREYAARNNASMSTVCERLVRIHLDMADAIAQEDTPKEAHDMAIITGEHPLIDIDLDEGER